MEEQMDKQRNGNSKNLKEMLKTKNTVRELKNAFDGFISTPDMAGKNQGT